MATIAIINVMFLAAGRGLEDQPDTLVYANAYETVVNGGGAALREPLYYWIAYATAPFNDHRYYFAAISLLSNLVLFAVYRSLGAATREHGLPCVDQLQALTSTMTLASPFFWAHQTNAVRSGLAIPLLMAFILARAFGRHRLALSMAVLALLAHLSSVIFLLSLSLRRLGIRSLTASLVVLLLLHLSGVMQVFVTTLVPGVAGSSQETIIYYLGYLSGGATNYRAGVRLDFLAVLVVFVVLAHFTRKREVSQPQLPIDFRKIAMSLSIPYLLLGWIPFADRLLGPIWYMVPVVIAVLISQRVRLTRAQIIATYCTGFVAVVWNAHSLNLLPLR